MAVDNDQQVPAKEPPKLPAAPIAKPQEKADRPRMVRDFWPNYRRYSIVVVILTQIIVTLVVLLALIQTEVIQAIDTTIIIIAIASLAAGVGLNVFLFMQLTIPLNRLSSAITKLSGEPTTTTPPNPNARESQRTGLTPLLQLLYDLASKDDSQTKGRQDVDFTEALNSSPLGLVILNKDHRISYANKNAPIRTNTEGAKELELLFDSKDSLRTWIAECEQRAVRAERVWTRVPDKIVGTEERRIYDVFASYNKDSAEEVVIVLLDKSGQYQPEDDALDFVAFAAHELRGPITVIRGYLDVLGDELEGTIDGDQVELLDRLVVSANRLSSYINNILNTARYDRRHLKMSLHEQTIATIYDSIRDDMELRARSQNRLLSVELPETLPSIAADKASVGEVLQNLIDNAIKYSYEGGVINVTAKENGNFVEVSVEDHGIGMPSSVVSNLFHKFYRSHRSRETVAGTGIGLYISKAIVESHGGTISVRSVENEGSTFTFNLPVYAHVAEKLQASGGSNESVIEHNQSGWIKNHSMFRG